MSNSVRFVTSGPASTEQGSECTTTEEEEKPTPERENASAASVATNSTGSVARRPPALRVGQEIQAAGPSGNGSAPHAVVTRNRSPIPAAAPAREKSPEPVPRSKPLSISPIKNVNRKRAATDRVKTLIFLDFETTGLFPGKSSPSFALRQSSDPRDFASELEKLIINTQKDGYPKITEMSFIAVPRDVFMKSMRQMGDYIPRVEATSSIRVRVPCNVHTRQVKPQCTEEEWRAYETQRMHVPAIVHSQEDLSSKNQFTTEWLQVKAFLDSCPKPACFVAHNGITFDYRVLYGELNANGMLAKAETTVPDGILFIDSLLAFQKIEDQQKMAISTVLHGINWSNVTASVAVKPPSTVDHDYASRNVPHDHPLNFVNKSGWSPAKLRRWTPEYFRKATTGQWEVCNRNGFRLGDLFKDIIKDRADFHYAQDDSDALLQICLAYGEDFIDYVDTCAAEIPF